ncbi:UDP-glucose dehydrogenase [Paenibacillus cellulosilyticus]|uniref:UDP-glucose 6-dehydrogenase n=1 Tax=Paenibacillus cellulosilyticus TaxID=375489 RepID=A0A2V2Z8N0_9BACL|nr:UDP-glucose/GDP-mannose dehydrogenase family protein [Paenibacillus cellulosilyticus]PWW08471.1 UDP-glucose dehydrogenase [Paenibacillus cellulosilyticus]QKS48056.1 UDP-glucose/GDP-mannose dehydrogenase family protein [Paenibacillus cellulosilyticus]
MKLAVIGTGYVGLVSGVCFSELGNEVVCVDNVQAKVDMLNNGEVPIHEPGLKELISSNMVAGRLSFTTDLASAVGSSEIIIIAVGTPSLPDGRANLTYIEQAAKEIGQAIDTYKVIVVKSTVPVGTNEKVADIIREYATVSFDFASVPEFLREGSAVKDTMNPDRIIIGTASERAAEKLTALHSPLTNQITITDVRSSEMIKYASNAFLATKISFINEIANICEKVGANVEEVANGMGMDRRIGSSFLKAGIGYGGSCFPKDTQALIQIAGQMDYDFKLLKSVVEVNSDQRFNVIRKLEELLGDVAGCTIGIWGLAFKPETDDVRDAPALDIIETLLARGAQVKAYDPIASSNFERNFNRSEVKYCQSAQEAATEADALCILTEWKEFSNIPLSSIQQWLKSPNLIDGRNIYREEDLKDTPFAYYSIGRPRMNNGVRESNPVLSF